MAAFGSWESYFYPPPDSATMRNVADIRDPEGLRVYEYKTTARRQRQLQLNPTLVEHTYDAAHLRAIRRYLFQDVYEWAGQFRSVNISKGMTDFADVASGQIEQYLVDVRRIVKATDWADLDRNGFGEKAATVFAYLNQAHPFREGNGRTSKIFMENVAQLSRFTLDFSRVSPTIWNNASMMSGPDSGAYRPVPDSLFLIFQHVAVYRD